MKWEDFSSLQCKLILVSCKRRYHNVNINVAVQTDNGLFVPVVRVCSHPNLVLIIIVCFLIFITSYISSWKICCWQDADKKGLSTISEEVKNLAQKAKEKSLKPQDYEVGIAVNYLLFHWTNIQFICFLFRRVGHSPSAIWEGLLALNSSVLSLALHNQPS